MCIGNLTAGGSGKTPVALEVARLASALGTRVFILARGHGGRDHGPTRVDERRHSARDVGDEALMMSRYFPVIVSRDREKGAREATYGGAEIIVLDDGHQDPRLHKSLSIVVVDGETRNGEWPFGQGEVIPVGPMREPFAEGLQRADVVVILQPLDVEEANAELYRVCSAKPIWIARWIGSPPPTGPQYGFAGVAKPWKVRRALIAAGCDLRDFYGLPDHAPVETHFLERMARKAAPLGGGLITTEKDWVRLPNSWRRRVVAWQASVRFEQEQEVSEAIRSILDDFL